MPDSNLSTSIAAVKTKITTDAPTATVDEILSLARAAKSVGLSEDAAVESAINSRVLTLSSGATTANMVKLANVIKQVRDATSSSGLTDISQLTDTTNLLSSGGGSSVTVSDTAPTSPSAGDQWYDSSSLTMFVYYADGSSSQWIPATPAGQTGATGAAGADGTDGTAGYATVVTDMAGLIAITGMVAGQTALVTALNKVFMYTGSAWFLIATMTNASPTTITGVAAQYALAQDGTATTITAISTDPEGFPLTWSYAVTTGSLGSTATVSQADNVFTVTPSSTEADAGTFSITFSVTDGATGAVQAVSAFTLTFTHNFLVSKIQNTSNANHDISGMFLSNAVCTLSSTYTTSGSDILVTDSSGTEWKLFASFTQGGAASGRWGGNKTVQGDSSTYDFSNTSTPRLPPYTSILSYGDIKRYGAILGGGVGGYSYESGGGIDIFNSVKLEATDWAPYSAASGPNSGYAYTAVTPTRGWINGGPSVAGGWERQSGGFMVIKPPQGTTEMWITGFNGWNGDGGHSFIIFNESDGAITSQAGHGNAVFGASVSDSTMLNDQYCFTTILPIIDGQLFMQHEYGGTAAGIAYVLTR